MASLEACFHLIKLLLLVSVGVGKGISSSYEHVDHFQFLLNKQSRLHVSCTQVTGLERTSGIELESFQRLVYRLMTPTEVSEVWLKL
jgi:hypothetical protein